jgi:Lecithin:cholesterol acyltransferase
MMQVQPEITQDAIMVIPGIMGSVLTEAATGRVLWGLATGWYVRAWCAPDGLGSLHLTEAERSGDYGRVKATGLLTAPAYMPMLRGQEPYTALVRALREIVADPSAIREFPYDWRLSVQVNARRLASGARSHLTAWRRHPSCRAAVQARPDRREARLVMVAHSMGGLLARALALPGVGDTEQGPIAADIRVCVTIGTPFDGAADALLLLNSGKGTPVALPKRQLRDLAKTLPGLHDLLPTYRCIDVGDAAIRLTPAEVARLGGDADLATESFDFHARLAETTLPSHRQIIGLGQPTMSTLTLNASQARGHAYSFEVNHDGSLVRLPNGDLKRLNRKGDGTVPRNSAELIHGTGNPPQRHGALASTPEVIRDIRRILTEKEPFEPRLGPDDEGPGLLMPDMVGPGQPWTITVTGVPRASCRITALDTGRELPRVKLGRRNDLLAADGPPLPPGLYRVKAIAGGVSPVAEIIMVTEPNAAA